MESKEIIVPVSPSGMRDYPPADMIPRTSIIETVRSVFERFGFDPLETPAIERRDVLTGNDPNFDMAIYSARIFGKRVNTESDTGLRFDLTVPLARFIAANPDIPKPFKRYQLGNVWRGEKVQKGRYREFMQFDADIVGSSSVQADVEIVWLICETLTRLEVGSFTVRFNSRKVLNGLPQFVGYDPSLNVRVLKTLDKLDKIGVDGVLSELRWTTTDGRLLVEGETLLEGDILAFSEDQINRLLAFVSLAGDSSDALLADAQALLESDVAQEGLRELAEMVASLRAIGVPENRWKVDFSVARGLGYYTGPVFEAVLDEMPEIGSVFSGGRYDNLLTRFGEVSVPATGASIGIDRLFTALTDMGKITPQKTNVEAMIMVLDRSLYDVYNGIAKELRDAGISTCIYLGDERSFKGQLAYALNQEIRFLVIVGDREVSDGTVTIKDTRTRKQVTVPRAHCVPFMVINR